LNDHPLIAEDGKYGIADGIQAVKVVRAHAAEWGISPDRIVLTGFSAGGMITGAFLQASLSKMPRSNLSPLSTRPRGISDQGSAKWKVTHWKSVNTRAFFRTAPMGN
jgi:hypothetical protein